MSRALAACICAGFLLLAVALPSAAHEPDLSYDFIECAPDLHLEKTVLLLRLPMERCNLLKVEADQRIPMTQTVVKKRKRKLASQRE